MGFFVCFWFGFCVVFLWNNLCGTLRGEGRVEKKILTQKLVLAFSRVFFFNQKIRCFFFIDIEFIVLLLKFLTFSFPSW